MAAIVLAAGTFWPGQVSAQTVAGPPSPSRVELWGALTLVPPAGTGTLASNYAPVVTSAPDARGHLGQTLTLRPATGCGLEFGSNLYLSRRVGIQVFASRTSAALGGSNTPYDVALEYTSRPPPTNQPVPVQIAWTVDWPDTAGRLRQWSAGAGPAVRWQGRRTAVVLSGGFAWMRLSGDAGPLGYTTFALGGHSTLFAQDVLVRAALAPSTTLAGYAAAALDVGIGRHAAITVSLRTLVAPEMELRSTIDAVIDGTEGATPTAVADIDRHMALAPARLPPSGVGILVGFKVR
ncbi:MAG: hypothetical protein AB7U83_07840 [Vicinamibacterales bacterium]